ncbi:neutral amino acid transporter [Clydaea vesicula]|uniref:Neutral amino acid transporter n=1 Tax=Clydaea vesicula TaxID=447962 RepID=A0AAD5XYM5_9FUNG|nr:neutral amino acid transporter [Clydaea vesicula]
MCFLMTTSVIIHMGKKKSKKSNSKINLATSSTTSNITNASQKIDINNVDSKITTGKSPTTFATSTLAKPSSSPKVLNEIQMKRSTSGTINEQLARSFKDNPNSFKETFYSSSPGKSLVSSSYINNNTNNNFGSPLPGEVLNKIVSEHLVASNELEGLGSVAHNLLGGDTTRNVYKWQERRESSEPIVKRRNSETDLHSLRSASNYGSASDQITASDLRVPGMMRRSYMDNLALKEGKKPPNHFTRNFIDFLVLYGFYGGDVVPEDSDDDDVLIKSDQENAFNERTPLVSQPRPVSTGPAAEKGISAKKAFFMLVKAFVGTGVLFLPKAFYNGGLGFSVILMVIIGYLTLHCMILLVEVSREFGGLSFGDVGGKLYGEKMRNTVLFSITLAQCGFCCAYYIFVAQNLRDILMLVSDCKLILPEWFFIVLQGIFLCFLHVSLTAKKNFIALIFIPLSWVRKIKHFGLTSLIADVFIVLGLGYIFYYDLTVLFTSGPAKDIMWINYDSFPLFVGTALFSFEGICLILPIVDSMKKPEKFNFTLSLCIVFIGVIFISVGGLGYLTFGSKVSTIVFLDVPPTPIVTLIQFLYGLAIMLSFPLTVYPAIRITENKMFDTSTSGKISNLAKWEKNFFRTFLVIFLALVAYFGSTFLDKFVSLVG